MTTLDYALAYIARGWSVIPLVPRSKHPVLKIATFLTGADRIDAAGAANWWGDGSARGLVNSGDQGYGIAIVTGKPSGLVVIDVDPRNGGDIRAVSDTLGDERQPRAHTGGGGMHILCAHPETGPVPCGKTSMPGVDRKGDGGYIVAAPSIHPNGTPYLWSAGWSDAQPSPLPPWVLAPTQTPPLLSGEGPSRLWVADTLAHPEECLPGGQEEALARLAWWAARHLERDIAEAILLQWLASLPLGNLYHPWGPDDLGPKLDRAYDKRPAPSGTVARLVDDSLATTIGCLASELTFPEQEWVIEEFAAPGCFTEIIGKVKKGKSTLTYQLIKAAIEGLPFLGRATTATPVVLLTEQTGTSLKKTMERASLLGAGQLFVILKHEIKAIGGWEQAVNFATDKAAELGAKLLVVDTLSRLASIGGDQENSSGAVRVLDCFARAKALGIASIFVRHARKGSSGEADEIADAARGSSAITGDMDIVLRLSSVAGDLRCLNWESRITDDPEDVFLEYDEGTYLVVDKPESSRTEDRRALFEAMRAADAKLGPDASRAAVMAEMGLKSCSRYTALRKALANFTHGPGVLPPTEDA